MLSDDEEEEEDEELSNQFPGKKQHDSSVILDLNPEKYEKPKDYLFFDFFSLYAKNFIGKKKEKRVSLA